MPGLGRHTAAPVPAPFFTVDRPKGPRCLVEEIAGGKTLTKILGDDEQYKRKRDDPALAALRTEIYRNRAESESSLMAKGIYQAAARDSEPDAD